MCLRSSHMAARAMGKATIQNAASDNKIPMPMISHISAQTI